MTRRQLSLYVQGDIAARLQALRRELDPVQYGLIPAHLTLCREDELGRLDTDLLQARLATYRGGPITLQFGRAESFGGHGILLPCLGGEDAFHRLRHALLDSASIIRTPRPHLTLAHPRNPRTPGKRLTKALYLPELITITFSSVCLIKQDLGAAWQVLQTFELVR